MGTDLRLALIQTELVWEEPEINRKNFSELLKDLSGKADLIVLPEMFTTGFTMNPERVNIQEGERSLSWMKDHAQKLNAAVVGSILYRDNNEFYNRLFFVLPDQSFFTYDKKHTFTYAGEDAHYSSGNERVVISYKGFSICPFICYDLRFPVWSRYRGDYDVLLYVANWPKPRIEAWDTLLRARAIENMCYTIGVNRIGEDTNGHIYSGHTGLYDPLGYKVAYSEEKEIIITSINLEYLQDTRNRFRFLEDRDGFNFC